MVYQNERGEIMGTFKVHQKLLADAEKITKLYQDKVPITKIASIEEVSFSTITKHLERLGLRLRKLRGEKNYPANTRYHYYRRQKVEKSKELKVQQKINQEFNDNPRTGVKHIKVDIVGEDARLIHYACGYAI